MKSGKNLIFCVSLGVGYIVGALNTSRRSYVCVINKHCVLTVGRSMVPILALVVSVWSGSSRVCFHRIKIPLTHMQPKINHLCVFVCMM